MKPIAGALPFEDPTIEPPRDENLKIEETPDAELAREADEPGVTPIEPEQPVAEPGEPSAPQQGSRPRQSVS